MRPHRPAARAAIPTVVALALTLAGPAALGQEMLGEQASKARLLRERDPTFLSLRILTGPGGRLDAGTYAKPDAVFGGALGLAIRPWPFASFSLSVGHDWLGRERPPAVGATAFSVTRELTTAWATIELVPWPMRRHAQLGPFDPFLQLGVGLASEHVGASGQLAVGPFAAPIVPFACGGDGGPSVGLRVGLGARAQLTRDAPRSEGTRTDSGLWFVGALGLDVTQAGASPIAACALGAGTVSAVVGRIGFEYEWNLTGPDRRSGS